MPPQSPGQSQDQVPKIRASTKKKRERKRKNHRKDSPATLTENHKSDGNGDTAQGYVTVLNVPQHSLPAQTLSLRWEGVRQDPQAEAKRLEQYRANRRQRYIAHREALLKETQDALRQTFPKEKKVPAKCDQQEAASLLQLSRHWIKEAKESLMLLVASGFICSQFKIDLCSVRHKVKILGCC